MTRLFAAAALAAVAFAAPAAAHPDGHGDHAAHAAAAAARLNLETPVEVVLADAAGKAVIDANIPELSGHEHYQHFKQMGLKQLASYAPDKLTPEVLAKVEAELAKIK